MKFVVVMLRKAGELPLAPDKVGTEPHFDAPVAHLDATVLLQAFK
jgi:hypothetical protein